MSDGNIMYILHEVTSSYVFDTDNTQSYIPPHENCPSTLNPGTQSHWNEASLLIQTCEQPSVCSSHSSTSRVQCTYYSNYTN